MTIRALITQQLAVYGYVWITIGIFVVWTVVLSWALSWRYRLRWHRDYQLFGEANLVEKITRLEADNEHLRSELATVKDRRDDLQRRMSVIDETAREPLSLISHKRREG